MSSLTYIEKLQLESLLEMGDGYVLDFSNASFGDFFHDAVEVDIFSERYAHRSGSKANRLRSFWEQEDDSLVATALDQLLEYWNFKRGRSAPESDRELYSAALQTVRRLWSGRPLGPTPKEDEDFLAREFGDFPTDGLPIDERFVPILDLYRKELQSAVSSGSNLSAVVMAGSLMEGVMQAFALKHAKLVTTSDLAPVDKNGKLLDLRDWRLSHLLNVLQDVGVIKPEVGRFGNFLREYRNYVHPWKQIREAFEPDEHTALICQQVVRSVVASLAAYAKDKQREAETIVDCWAPESWLEEIPF